MKIMTKKPDQYYWRGTAGDGWSRRESANEEQTGSWHGVGTQGLPDDLPEDVGISFAGCGPRNYQRSDERIGEDINERLTRAASIDATNVEVRIQDGEVTLLGVVHCRHDRDLAENIASAVSGVKEVNNHIRIDS